MSNDSGRKYSNELPSVQAIPANSKPQNQSLPTKSSPNLLNKAVMERVVNDPNYELFGFVYKIKAFEFPASSSNDLDSLSKVELICKDPNSSLNQILGKKDGSSQGPKITVFTIPDTNGNLCFNILIDSDLEPGERSIADSFSKILSHVSMKSSVFESVNLIYE